MKTEHFACGHEAFVCRVKCEELRSEQEAQKQARIDQAAQEAKEQQLASERAKEEAKQSAAAQAKAAAQAEEESKAAAAAAREREAEGQSNPTTPDIQPDSDDSGETDENAAETLENSEDISSADDEVASLPEPANIEQWEKATSEDGKTYWWNPETQETSWTDPSIAQSQLDGESPDESGDKTEGAGVAAEWREATSPEGKTYWWNTVTQETSWTDPAVVEEATQAPTMDPTPSSSAKRKLKPDRQKSYTPTPPVDAVGEDATGSEQVEQSTNTVPQGEIASSSEVNQAKAATVDDENPTPAPTRKESRRERRRRLAREKAAKKSQRSQSDDKAATPETTAPSSENGESSVDHAANSAVGGQSEQVIAQDNTQGDPANAATPAEESPVEASGEPAIAADAGQRALDEAVDSFGRLDIAVANAGITTYGNFLDYPPERFQQLVHLNLQGTFFLIQRAARQMIQQGQGGRILLMSSVTGHQYHPELTAYGMSKAAIRFLAKTLGVELAPHQITVNAISPGATLTVRTEALDHGDFSRQWEEITPTQRPATTEDIAHTALFLLSPQSKQITGQTIIVDGGWTATSPPPTPLNKTR